MCEDAVGGGDGREREVQLCIRPGWVGHVVGKDTNHGKHTGVERQRHSEDVGVSAETILPQSVREDRYVRSRALFIRCE